MIYFDIIILKINASASQMCLSLYCTVFLYSHAQFHSVSDICVMFIPYQYICRLQISVSYSIIMKKLEPNNQIQIYFWKEALNRFSQKIIKKSQNSIQSTNFTNCSKRGKINDIYSNTMTSDQYIFEIKYTRLTETFQYFCLFQKFSPQFVPFVQNKLFYVMATVSSLKRALYVDSNKP